MKVDDFETKHGVNLAEDAEARDPSGWTYYHAADGTAFRVSPDGKSAVFGDDKIITLDVV